MCLLCDRRSADPVCDRCQAGLVRMLAEIEDYVAIMSPVRAQRPAERGSPGFRSASPADDHVIAMEDARTRITGDGPDDRDYEVYGLDVLCVIAGNLTEDGPALRYPIDAARFLRVRMGDCCAAPWIGDMSAEVTALHRQLRTACGDVPPRPICQCWDMSTGQPCGGPVFWMLAEPPQARCRRCQRLYAGLDLVRLRMSQESEAM